MRIREKVSRTVFNLVLVILFAGCVKFQRASLNPSQLYNEYNARRLESIELKKFIEEKTGKIITNWPPQVWDFELLALAGLYFNPSLESARASGKVAESAIISAGARPNPGIAPVGGINQTALGQAGINPWIPAVTLNFPIETANKRAYRIAVASNKTEVAKLNIVLTSWQIRSNIRSAYIELLANSARSNVLHKKLQILNKVKDAMEAQLAGGEIKATEITPVTFSIANTEIELGSTIRDLNSALSQLASAIGVPVNAIRRANLNLNLDVNTNLFSRFSKTNMIEFSLKTRADILAALYEYETAQSALQLEIAKQYPDINLSPGYQWDQAEHKWTLGITFDLPVFNRNQGPIAEALANRNLAAAKFNELQINVVSAMESAIVEARSALEQINRFSSVQEAQKKHLSNLEAQLKFGVIDLLTIEQAKAEFLAIEKQLVEAYISWVTALGKIENAFLLPLEKFTPAE